MTAPRELNFQDGDDQRRRLRVIDAGSRIAGPAAATFLGDLGAEVIKIESPRGGDMLRHAHTGPHTSGDLSSYWLVEGRNKLPVTLNLKTSDGQELLKRLVDVSDVLIENLGFGRMDAWGIGPDVLRAINPRLVYVRITGFGTGGPYSDLPSLDRLAYAFSGAAHLTGYPDGPPAKPGLVFSDYCAALLAALGALEAVRRRDAIPDGKGDTVDVSLYDAILRFSEGAFIDYAAAGLVRQRDGGISHVFAPGGFYKTRDGRWIAVVISGIEMFLRLIEATGGAVGTRDGVAEPEMTRTSQEEVHAAMTEWVAAHDFREVLDRLTAAGVGAGPVNTVADLFEDPHIAARGDLVHFDGPDGSPLRMQGVVPRLEQLANLKMRHAGRPLGDANQVVYGEILGLSREELEELAMRGIV